MSSDRSSDVTNDDSTNGSGNGSSDLAAFTDTMREYVRTWRWIASAAFAGLLLTLAAFGVVAWSLLGLASDTNDIVTTLDDATGPKAQATARRTVSELVAEIDCRNANRLQRTIDALVERGVLAPGSLTVIDEACVKRLNPKENP